MNFHQRLRAELASRPPLWKFYRQLRKQFFGETEGVGPVFRVLKRFASECSDARFVQVGSCDAGFGDPIIQFVQECGWCGIMVEPVPHVFELLRARHGRNPRLTLENCAIGEQDGIKTFYCMEPLAQPLSPWYHQLGSFSRAHIEKHERFSPGLSKHIREIAVPCLKLSSLINKHGVSQLDLLHIDAEGADFEVLKSLDFGACSPGIVLFELGHLPRADRTACVEFLEARNYRVLYEGRDCLALHESARSRWPKTAISFDAHALEP